MAEDTPGEAFDTARVHVRRFTDEDAWFVLKLHQNPDLARFIPTALQRTLEDARAWIERAAERAAPQRGWWLVERRDTGVPVAALLLVPIRASEGTTTDAVEIGWRQAAAHTGNGYVTEAAGALLQIGFDAGLNRIIAVTDPHNVASQRVCERLGMRRLGRTDAYYDVPLIEFEIDAAPIR